jgi:Dolichyl-phosphate-mannose-protein mannosyltransferase
MRTLETAASPWLVRSLVAALSVAFALQAWTSLRRKSLTFDEVTYIPSGYSYVVTRDYRLNPEHPPLAKLLAGLAVLPLHPALDTSQPAWQTADQWTFGRDFFEGSGVDTARLVSAARLPTVLLGMVLVALAYALGSELYGRGAGLLAAWLAAFSPTLLAHGRLATNDLPLTCLVLLTTYAVLRFSRRPTVSRLALAGVALGLALLTKYIAVLLLGLVPLWLLASVIPEGRLPVPDTRWLGRVRDPRLRRASFAIGSATAIVLIGLAVVTLAYLKPGDLGPYVHGLRVLYTNVHLDMRTYFHGTFHDHRLPYYFVATFLLKTPTPFLALLALRAGDQAARRDLDLDTGAFLLLPSLLWLVVISTSALAFGVRYILPVYPLLFVYVSGIVRSPLLRTGWAKASVVGLAALFAAASLRAYPNYIPYFNVLAGGPRNGVEWLDDSNIDWGQDLPMLRDYVEQHGIADLTVAPMGWYDPALYGVHGRVVDPAEMFRLLADPNAPHGAYAISAHLLTRGRYFPTSFDALSRLEPTAILGYSLYVYER